MDKQSNPIHSGPLAAQVERDITSATAHPEAIRAGLDPTGELDLARRTIANLEKQLTAKREKVDAAKKIIHTLKAELDSRNRKFVAVREKLDEAKKKIIPELLAKREELETEKRRIVTGLMVQVASREEKLEIARDMVHKLSDQSNLFEAKRRIQELTKELKKEGNNLVAELSSQLDESQGWVETLRADAKELESENERLAKLFDQASSKLLPLPPAEIRAHSGASLRPGVYYQQGLNSAQFVDCIFPNGPSGKVLDFGCGCGRTYFWLARNAKWKNAYTGCDTDPDAVAWLKNQGAKVDISSASPPLSYAAQSFKTILALSVFTHIRPDNYAVWLEELSRVMEKGGELLMTLAGTTVVADARRFGISRAAQQQFQSKGVVWIERASDFRSFAIVSEDFFRKQLGKNLEIVSYSEQGFEHFDVIRLKKI